MNRRKRKWNLNYIQYVNTSKHGWMVLRSISLHYPWKTTHTPSPWKTTLSLSNSNMTVYVHIERQTKHSSTLFHPHQAKKYLTDSTAKQKLYTLRCNGILVNDKSHPRNEHFSVHLQNKLINKHKYIFFCSACRATQILVAAGVLFTTRTQSQWGTSYKLLTLRSLILIIVILFTIITPSNPNVVLVRPRDRRNKFGRGSCWLPGSPNIGPWLGSLCPILSQVFW